MALSLILLLFALLFLLSAPIKVNVNKRARLKIEIHMPIFALILTDNKEKKKKSDKKQNKLSAPTYIRIIMKQLKRFDGCGLTVKKVVVPDKSKNFSYSTLMRPYAYQALVYTLIAYLRTHLRMVRIMDNAVSFIPDNKEFLCEITITGRLFEIAFGAFCLYKNIKKEKRLSFSR